MVFSMIAERGQFQMKTDWNGHHDKPFRFSDADDKTLICSCENVTEEEIVRAIHNPLGVHTLSGIKYRTRAMMGRCQSGFCHMKIEHLIERECGTRAEDVRYMRPGSWVLAGKMRECNGK